MTDYLFIHSSWTVNGKMCGKTLDGHWKTLDAPGSDDRRTVRTDSYRCKILSLIQLWPFVRPAAASPISFLATPFNYCNLFWRSSNFPDPAPDENFQAALESYEVTTISIRN